jgi:hypothetical protein
MIQYFLVVSFVTDGLHVFFIDDVYLYVKEPSIISPLKDVDIINLLPYTVPS